MSLSTLEKVKIGKRIKENVTALMAGDLPMIKKVQAGKQIKADVALLINKAAEIIESLFQQIAKGIHDAIGAVEVFKKIKAEIDRIGEDTIAFDLKINTDLHKSCEKLAQLTEAEGIA